MMDQMWQNTMIFDILQGIKIDLIFELSPNVNVNKDSHVNDQ